MTPGKRAPGFIGGPAPLRRLAWRFPTTTFMILTFVITWVVWVPRALASQRYMDSEWPVTIGPFSTYGPAVAAVLAAALSGGCAGLRQLGSRLIRWRARWWLYLVVLLGPAAFWMCVVAVNALVGSSDRLARPILAEQGWRAAVPLFFFLAATDGVGEETGWRGYALPRQLEQFGVIPASLVLGAIWAVWHLPLLDSWNHSVRHLGLDPAGRVAGGVDPVHVGVPAYRG